MKRTALTRLLFFAATCLALVAPPGIAQLTIEITGGGANPVPIAVLSLAGERQLPESITDIVEADLQRSGRFRLQYAGSVGAPPTDISQVDFTEWRNRNADFLVIGAVQRLPDGRFEVRFRLLDVQKRAQSVGVGYTLTPAQLRLTAHKISDAIYENVTGERGVFSTRVAYVVKQGARYELKVADADGQNAQTALASREPIVSP
ncbi:MAG: Tol-Pal system protein TolB, partial [Burkholderiales bacterium]|nr:Tol-Pal system protein TolB [Burkholderiales bacterium]